MVNALLSNPAFVTALITLIGAVTAWVQLKVQQARQGERIDALKEQMSQQGQHPAPPATLQLPAGTSTVHVQPAEGSGPTYHAHPGGTP